MLIGKEVLLRRLEKADLWSLWEEHEKEELYLFKFIKSFVLWDELYDNFHSYFAWKGDFVIEGKASNLLGICSYYNINWKNRSCSISFKMTEKGCKFLYSVDAIQVLTSMIFNELNLIKIESYILQILKFEIQTIKKSDFSQEGLLREHVFRDNKYFDTNIFSLFRKDVSKYD